MILSSNQPLEISDRISLADTITNLRQVCMVSTTTESELKQTTIFFSLSMWLKLLKLIYFIMLINGSENSKTHQIEFFYNYTKARRPVTNTVKTVGKRNSYLGINSPDCQDKRQLHITVTKSYTRYNSVTIIQYYQSSKRCNRSTQRQDKWETVQFWNSSHSPKFGGFKEYSLVGKHVNKAPNSKSLAPSASIGKLCKGTRSMELNVQIEHANKKRLLVANNIMYAWKSNPLRNYGEKFSRSRDLDAIFHCAKIGINWFQGFVMGRTKNDVFWCFYTAIFITWGTMLPSPREVTKEAVHTAW